MAQGGAEVHRDYCESVRIRVVHYYNSDGTVIAFYYAQ